jgi:hypothetical protein
MIVRESDNYLRRMVRCTIAALAVHVLLIVLFGAVGALNLVEALGPAEASNDPLVLNLQPPDRARNFVDTAVPADQAPTPDTDLISDKASKASDLQDSAGERLAPRMDRISDIDDLAGPQTPRPPAPPQPPAQPSEQSESSREADQESRDEVIEPSELDALTAMAQAEEKAPPMADETPEQVAERVQMAQAQPESMPPSPPQPHLGAPKARPDGGAPGKGFVGFEALEHELGPYLKQVRERVERNWRAALEMRFSGAARTKAVLDCAISPEGKLVRVKIVEPGDSPTYAVLCRQAIEKAAPFPPFPFDVPAIYRTRNLEIRWTFSFL